MKIWRESVGVYANRPALVFLFLGFSSGLPFGVVAEPLASRFFDVFESKEGFFFRDDLVGGIASQVALVSMSNYQPRDGRCEPLDLIFGIVIVHGGAVNQLKSALGHVDSSRRSA